MLKELLGKNKLLAFLLTIPISVLIFFDYSQLSLKPVIPSAVNQLIYYVSPFFKLLTHFFFFLFYIVPRDVYISCGGGWISFCLPNGYAALFYLISLLFTFSFFWLGIGLFKKFVGKRILWLFPLTVVLLLFISFPVEQMIRSEKIRRCVENYLQTKSIDGTRYLNKTGVITFVFDNVSNPNWAESFYKLHGLTYISGTPNTSGIIAKVPVGKEFEKLCTIKMYKQIFELSDPLTERDLQYAPKFWQYFDVNFCQTNQIDPTDCQNKIRSYQ